MQTRDSGHLIQVIFFRQVLHRCFMDSPHNDTIFDDISQSPPGYDFNLIQYYVPIWHNQFQKKQVRRSVFSPKSKIFPHWCLIPEKGVHIFIVLFLAACHHLPGTNTVWRFMNDMRRDVPGEGQDKVMMWVDIFTLHQSTWVADHFIDISNQINGLPHLLVCTNLASESDVFQAVVLPVICVLRRHHLTWREELAHED